MTIQDIVSSNIYDISDPDFLKTCENRLNQTGVLALENFLTAEALAKLQREAVDGQDKAYFCTQSHSVYLTPQNSDFAPDHPQNRLVESSKGCICDDDVAEDSVLRALYNAEIFKNFISVVTGQSELHPYADPLSSINIHYANRGQELGWHFDNSDFAITLLIEKPTAGARFEYIKNLRNAAAGDMNYDGVADLLDGKVSPNVLTMEPGTLVLFKGRNSIHRVSPNESDKTRMLAVLAYNAEAGIELSQSARQTFYGRLS